MKTTLSWFFLIVCSVASAQPMLPDFTSYSTWAEQNRIMRFTPDVRILVNAPLSVEADRKPIKLLFFALPNGNTIEQTFGRTVKEGMDWHYGIQHIGAQTRLLRKRDTSSVYVVAYLEAATKSWPAWRKNTPESGDRLKALIDTVRSFLPSRTSVMLSAHSGGGSLLFGFINAHDEIPSFIERIVFLDANYGYTLEDRHAEKMLNWTRRSVSNALIVIAYDDREITLNGKKVLSPTGGTYRRTVEMVSHFDSLGVRWVTTQDSSFTYYESANPKVYFALHRNPQNEILHTILVEKNGFLEGIVHFQPDANKISRLWNDVEYREFVNP
jgi:hypothetical protein